MRNTSYTDHMKDQIIEKITDATDESLIRYIYTMLMESITSSTKDGTAVKDIATVTEKQAVNF